MMMTKDGSKWVMGVNGDLLRAEKDGDQTLFSTNKGTIWDLKEVDENTLLLFTASGYYVFDRNSGVTSPTSYVAKTVNYFEDNAWTKLGDRTTYLHKNNLFIDENVILGSKREIVFVMADNNQQIWVATSGDGLYKISRKRMITLGENLHPQFQNIYGLDEYEGSIWATSFEGRVFKFSDAKLSSWSLSHLKEKASFNRSVLARSSNEVYVGNFGLWKSDNKGWKPQSSFPEQNDLVDVIFEDSSGRLWVGTRHKTYLAVNDTYVSFEDTKGQEIGGISSITQLENKELAFSTVGKGIAFLSNQNELRFVSDENGLSSNLIRDVFEASSDTLWAASEDKGLNRIILDENRNPIEIKTLLQKDGLSDNSLHKILRDDYGFFWINSNSGIMRVHQSEVNAYLDKEISSLSLQTFLEKDGLENIEGNGGTQQSGLLTGDGKLFFANQAGLVFTRPEWHIDQSQLLPPVFESISISDSVVNVVGRTFVDLQQDVRNIRVRFTIPNLHLPKNLNLQYKLEGVQEEWQTVSSERTAVFTNLPSGKRTLYVRGRLDGSQNYSEAALSIHIAPFFYETAPFFFLVALMLGGAIYSGYRFLLFQSKEREKKLERQVDERTKELVVEKEKTEEAYQMIKKLDASKSEFFTNFTHELRTPLSLILSPLEEMLETQVLDKTTKKAPLSLMMRSATRLKNLVNQLLDISKLSSGELTLKFEPVDIADFTTKLSSQFDHAFHQHSLTFETQIDPKIEPIYVDVSAWEHICTNIIGNAVKFTPEGGRINIEIRDSDGFITLSFSDTGCGIPADELPFIFDPYYQGNSSTAKVNGTGIGLAFVKGLVNKMGGEIGVTSEVGKGTTFEIKLRKGTEHISKNDSLITSSMGFMLQKRADSIEVEVDEVVPSHLPPNAKKVLYVEDNPDFRSYITSLLGRQYHVVTAKNGNEGLEKLASFSPDIVVSDIMMPEMSGFEMMEKIREQKEFENIPFIFLSAMDGDEDIQRGLHLGADVYLTKPVQNKLLLTQIKALLRREASLKTTVLDEHSPNNSFVENTMQIIKRHLGNPDLNVDLIAKAMAISSATLHRNWRKEQDESINQTITKLRLEEAMKLLREEQFNVSEAAYAVGYNHSSHFSRSFKKAYGVSPKEFVQTISQ